jgi:hypothetical protein
LLVLRCYQLDRSLPDELVDGPLDTSLPPTPFLIVVTRDESSCSCLAKGKLEIFPDEVVQVIAIDVDPIEIVVRESGKNIARTPSMNSYLPRPDLVFESLLNGLIPMVHFCLSTPGSASVPGVVVQTGRLVSPGIDEVQFPGGRGLQDCQREIPPVDTDFGANRIFGKHLQQEEPMIRRFVRQATEPDELPNAGHSFENAFQHWNIDSYPSGYLEYRPKTAVVTRSL